MKKKSNSIGIIISLLVCALIALMILNVVNTESEMLKNCKENGYEGVQTKSTLMGPYQYRCYKKVQLDVGYELEYSGIIDVD